MDYLIFVKKLTLQLVYFRHQLLNFVANIRQLAVVPYIYDRARSGEGLQFICLAAGLTCIENIVIIIIIRLAQLELINCTKRSVWRPIFVDFFLQFLDGYLVVSGILVE